MAGSHCPHLLEFNHALSLGKYIKNDWVYFLQQVWIFPHLGQGETKNV